MIRIDFEADDVAALERGRYYHEHPRVRIKMNALWLKSQGKPHKEICKLAGITKVTLVKYLKQYQEEGLEGLQSLRFHKPTSEMTAYSDKIKAYFVKHPPASLKEAAAAIEKLTGLKRSTVQVSQFLKTLGFKPRRVSSIPAKLDPEAQADFVKKTWNPA